MISIDIMMIARDATIAAIRLKLRNVPPGKMLSNVRNWKETFASALKNPIGSTEMNAQTIGVKIF